MPPFLDDMLLWSRMTAGHFLLMFWWIWTAAVALTGLGESFWIDGRRRRVLERPADGWRTVWLAVQLGVLSPPSRTRIFRQARELLARGVSPLGVMAYLVSAQSLLLWLLFFIVELDGPQPAVGLAVAVAAALAVLAFGLARTPAELWAEARANAARELPGAPERASAPIGRAGPAWLRLLRSAAGQVYSLWWPMLFGTIGVGFFLALGQSSGYFSLQGTRGPLIQAANAGAGLLLAYVTGAPLVGHALIAAGLWKADFVTYAGLSAFYLGTMITPFVLARYYELLGVALAKRVLVWLVVAIVAGSLAATAWWWGLDGLAGLLGVRDAFEAFTASTLRPNNVPWFHHWFAPGL